MLRSAQSSRSGRVREPPGRDFPNRSLATSLATSIASPATRAERPGDAARQARGTDSSGVKRTVLTPHAAELA